MFDRDELEAMIDIIVRTSPDRRCDGDNDFYESQTYHEWREYHDCIFDVTPDTPYTYLEIRYKGKLVFKASDKRTYYKTGEWENKFNRLHSRARNTLDSWLSYDTGYRD